MQFTIYSLGSADFLEQVLNSVAMITGTGQFQMMVKIGLLLAFIIICFQSLFNGAKDIDVSQIFVAWIVYAIAFGPTATVLIHDTGTARVKVVDNVPLGPAFAGGVISNIGYGITKLFEQGYAVISPGITEDKYFAESLTILHDIRRKAHDDHLFASMNTAAGGRGIDMKESLNNYIMECTLSKIDLGIATADSLSQESVMTALQFDSPNLMTQLFLEPGNPSGRVYTCKDGWSKLEAAINKSVESDTVSNTLAGILQFKSTVEAPVDMKVKMNDALEALGKMSSNSMDYLKASLIEPVYLQAAEGRYKDFQDMTTALAINQAIQQRNIQWSAEQSMFMTTVRPMLAFFEGFVYAITPILAFLILLGKSGIGLAVKYAQVIIWIQLWLPVLSIINLFIHSAAAGAMDVNGGIGNIGSMYAINETSEILQTWISTGGMLAAATPIISLFIVTGSTYALTGLAGRLNGADHFNEKAVVPDATQQGPLLNVGAANTYNANDGVSAAGSQGLAGQLNFKTGSGLMVSSAENKLEQASNSFTSSLGSAFTRQATSQETYNRAQSVGRALQSTDAEAYNAISKQTSSFMTQAGISQDHKEAVNGVASMVASGAISAEAGTEMLSNMASQIIPGGQSFNLSDMGDGSGNGNAVSTSGNTGNNAVPGVSQKAKFNPVDVGGSVSATMSGKADNLTSDSETLSNSRTTSFLKGVDLSKSDANQFTNALSEQFSEGKTSSLTQSFSEADTKQLSKTASEMQSASQAYSEAQSWDKTLGSTTAVDYDRWASHVSENKNAMGQLSSAIAQAPKEVRDRANALEDLYSSKIYNHGDEKARALAQMKALTETATASNLSGYQQVTQAIATATGMDFGTNVNPDQNKGLAENVSTGGSVQQEVNRGVDTSLAAPDNFVGDVEKGINQTPATTSLPTDGSGTIQADYSAGTQGVIDKAQDWRNTAASERVSQLENEIINDSPNMGAAAAIYGAFDNSTAVAQRQADRAIDTLGAGYTSASNASGQKIEDLKGMAPEARDQFVKDLTSDNNFAETVGHNIAGLIGKGYEAFDSDAKIATEGMSLEEKGAFYTGAMVAAKNAGAEEMSNFYSKYGDDFRETMSELGISKHGLNDTQSDIYAQQFSLNNYEAAKGMVVDSPAEVAAITRLKEEYAERDSQGNIMRNEDTGQPILTKHNERLTDAIVEQIQHSSWAGDHAGSYLTGIAEYNDARQGFNLK